MIKESRISVNICLRKLEFWLSIANKFVPFRLTTLLIISFLLINFLTPQEASAASMTFTSDTTIISDETIEEGEVWTIEENVTLNVAEGVTVKGTIGGKIRNFGDLVNSGDISFDNSEIKNSGTFINKNKITITEKSIFENGELFINEGTVNITKEGLLANKGTVTNNGTIFKNCRGLITRNVPTSGSGVENEDGCAPAETEIRVIGRANDAEERKFGSVAIGTSDLEFVRVINEGEGGDQTVGLRFKDLGVPQGAIILNAYLQFTADEKRSEPTALTIHGQASDDAEIFLESDFNISSRPLTPASVAWSPLPWRVIGEAGLAQRTPNIAPVIQEIVNRPGWTYDNALVTIITGEGKRTAVSYGENRADSAPLLHIDFTSGQNPPALKVRVAAREDDAEERKFGTVAYGSSDLEFVRVINEGEGGDQIVGLRFNGITIPRGATILNSFIQFTADEKRSEPTSLTIHGEASDNTKTFSRTDFNISSRPLTTASVEWSPAPWTVVGEAGPSQRTPDIAPVIQEIVNRPGWSYENSLVTIITGEGKRTAVSYGENRTEAAALLCIRFTTTNSDTVPPSAPTNLVATTITSTSVRLTWNASTDDGGVAGYKVFRDGQEIAQPATNHYTDTGLPSSTEFSYFVQAMDSSGNISGPSNTLSIKTLPEIDDQAPVTSISPPPGVYTEIVTVSLVANEAGTVFYTLDGSTPVANGPTTQFGASPVSGITLTSSTIIHFFSVSTAGHAETVNSAMYTISLTTSTVTVDRENGDDNNDGIDGPKKSIASAVSSAVPGTKIIVAPGVYSGGNIDFGGKQLVLCSSAGPEVTIIDLQDAAGIRGFHFHSDETNQSIPDGFTIRNGNPGAKGGAILIESASPTIINCIIESNIADEGGGIYVDNNASPHILATIIRENAATTNGGGIYFHQSSSPQVKNCVIAKNEAGQNGAGVYGKE